MKLFNDYSLYLVTDTKQLGKKNLTDVISSAIVGGVTAVQLREKEMSSREFVELARKVKSILLNTTVPLFINDRIDIAIAAGADGVHLGQSDIHFIDAKREFGNKLLIGLTVETIKQILEANESEVEYLGVSSIFPTSTKSDVKYYWSKEMLIEARALTTHKLIGIGGINKHNLQDVLSCGLDGIAVVSAICNLGSIEQVEQETRLLKTLIEDYNGYR